MLGLIKVFFHIPLVGGAVTVEYTLACPVPGESPFGRAQTRQNGACATLELQNDPGVKES